MYFDYKQLSTIALFSQIKEAELSSLLTCLEASKHFYRKGQTIFSHDEKVKSIGVILCGSVQVVNYDVFGNRSIIGELSQNELFAESFTCAKLERFPVGVEAQSDCEILLLNYKKIIHSCASSCSFHHRLVENMLGILASKNLLLNQKIRHISKRSTREKLLSYLFEQAQNHHNKKFVIPFNRQELADYLCVERSAMSNELGKMRAEGILTFRKNEFELYND